MGGRVIEAVLEPGFPLRPHPVFPAYRRRVRADVPIGQGLRKAGVRHRHHHDQGRGRRHPGGRTAVAKPFCKLLHFKKDLSDTATAALAQPTVLLVAPLSGHHSTLLRDTVRALLPDHDVFITDWIDARMVPLSDGPFHLHDYIYYVQDFIRTLGPDVHVISVCQPTVPVLAAISLMASNKDPKLPKTMTMMGGPIDPRKSPTAVNDLATEKPFSWFENTVIYAVPGNYPGFGRKVYPGFLQHAGFIAMNPGRHAQSHREFYQHLVRGDDESAESHRQFYDEYNAVLDMPAEYYLDTIKTVFQEFRLPKGTWEVGGQLVRPQDIKTVALFTVEGELDDISGAGQTQAAHDAVQQHSGKHEARLRGAESRPLRHLLGPPLARDDLPEDRRIHPRIQLTEPRNEKCRAIARHFFIRSWPASQHLQ
jgi:poly(3-hydroxybutyrate) depolymerase